MMNTAQLTEKMLPAIEDHLQRAVRFDSRPDLVFDEALPITRRVLVCITRPTSDPPTEAGDADS